jgi:hypothetical protein
MVSPSGLGETCEATICIDSNQDALFRWDEEPRTAGAVSRSR